MLSLYSSGNKHSISKGMNLHGRSDAQGDFAIDFMNPCYRILLAHCPGGKFSHQPKKRNPQGPSAIPKYPPILAQCRTKLIEQCSTVRRSAFTSWQGQEAFVFFLFQKVERAAFLLCFWPTFQTAEFLTE